MTGKNGLGKTIIATNVVSLRSTRSNSVHQTFGALIVTVTNIQQRYILTYLNNHCLTQLCSRSGSEPMPPPSRPSYGEERDFGSHPARLLQGGGGGER